MAGSRREVQHVAVAEQPVGTAFVQHHSAVCFAGDLERDPCRKVGLDESGDDVDRRFLSRQDQVNADGS